MTEDTSASRLDAVAIAIRRLTTDIDYAGDALYERHLNGYGAGVAGSAAEIRYLVLELFKLLDKIDPNENP